MSQYEKKKYRQLEAIKRKKMQEKFDKRLGHVAPKVQTDESRWGSSMATTYTIRSNLDEPSQSWDLTGSVGSKDTITNKPEEPKNQEFDDNMLPSPEIDFRAALNKINQAKTERRAKMIERLNKYRKEKRIDFDEIDECSDEVLGGKKSKVVCRKNTPPEIASNICNTNVSDLAEMTFCPKIQSTPISRFSNMFGSSNQSLNSSNVLESSGKTTCQLQYLVSFSSSHTLEKPIMDEGDNKENLTDKYLSDVEYISLLQDQTVVEKTFELKRRKSVQFRVETNPDKTPSSAANVDLAKRSQCDSNIATDKTTRSSTIDDSRERTHVLRKNTNASETMESSQNIRNVSTGKRNRSKNTSQSIAMDGISETDKENNSTVVENSTVKSSRSIGSERSTRSDRILRRKKKPSVVAKSSQSGSNFATDKMNRSSAIDDPGESTYVLVKETNVSEQLAKQTGATRKTNRSSAIEVVEDNTMVLAKETSTLIARDVLSKSTDVLIDKPDQSIEPELEGTTISKNQTIERRGNVNDTTCPMSVSTNEDIKKLKKEYAKRQKQSLRNRLMRECVIQPKPPETPGVRRSKRVRFLAPPYGGQLNVCHTDITENDIKNGDFGFANFKIDITHKQVEVKSSDLGIQFKKKSKTSQRLRQYVALQESHDMVDPITKRIEYLTKSGTVMIDGFELPEDLVYVDLHSRTQFTDLRSLFPSTIFVRTMFSVQGLVTGQLIFGANAEKEAANSNEQTIIYEVVTGTFRVTINKQTRFVGNEISFIIYPHNTYDIKNMTNMRGKLCFSMTSNDTTPCEQTATHLTVPDLISQ